MNRKKKKKGLRPIRVVILALFVASLAVILFSLPVWKIKNVEVSGNKNVPSEMVLAKASVSMDGNIFFLNYREVTRRVKSIQQVKNAWVYGSLPSAVVIRVEERKPFAVAVVGGEYLVVDDEGFIIDQVKGQDKKTLITAGITELPTVIGLPADSVEKGKRIRPEVMDAVEKSFKLLGSMFERSRFELEMKDRGDIAILINDMLRVKIGDSGEIDKKLRDLSSIIQKIESRVQDVEYIDVRVPGDPAVRFKD